MSLRNLLDLSRFWLATAVVVAGVSQVSAVTIASSNFSLGFSVDTNGSPNGGWRTNETNSANTPVTTSNANNTGISLGGGFTLTPAINGGYQTGNGPTFLNRTFASGTGTNYVGGSPSFAPSLTGAYGLTLPINATNIETTLNITSLSLRVTAINGSFASFGGISFSTPLSFHFHETTLGHTAMSGATTVSQITTDPFVSPFPTRAISNYTQAIWNPTEFALAGTSATRSFNVDGFGASGSSGVLYFIDGFEITGNIVVTYAIPEPGSLGLFVTGLFCLAFLRRR